MKNILVLCDVLEETAPLIEQANILATAFKSKVWLIHVAAPNPDFVGYEPGPQHERDFKASKLRKEHTFLQKEAEKLRNSGIDAKSLLLEGPTAETILKKTSELSIDLLILGHHSHGKVYKTLHGSVSDEIIRKAPCPLLLIPDNK